LSTTRALKARIIRQIRALEADLRAIERVEEIERRHDQDGGAPEPDAATLIGTVDRLLREEWTPVSVYLGLVQAERPKASRATVSTALMRLTDRGIAEARGERKSGYEYKRKKSALAAEAN
jgi:DNA-binding transcriptional ArsR family regulator